MITKEDIKYYCVDVSGSDFIHFKLSDELKIGNDTIGEYYWQGKTEELGNEFTVMVSCFDELLGLGDEDEDEDSDENIEKLSDFLDEEAIDLVQDVVRNYYEL